MKLKLSYFFLIAAVFFNLNVSAQPEMDTTFSSDGKVAVQFFSISSADGLAIQPDNKVLMVGGCSHVSFGSVDVCLVRLNENGSYDTTFGTSGGYVLTHFTPPSGNQGSSEIALQNDGRIVVAGWSTSSIVLVRYSSNGIVDTTFGTNGFAQKLIGPNARTTGLAIQPDGKIVVLGYHREDFSYTRQFVMRFLPDGTPDSSFGTNGTVEINIAGYYTSGSSLALQADGKIVTGGSMWTPSGAPTPSGSFLLTRLNRDGSLDASFDEDGYKTIVFSTTSFPGYSLVGLAVQSDARITAVSSTNVLYRFNADGSLDTGFDGDGSRAALPGTATPSDLTVSPSGRITVIGIPAYSGSNYSALLYRVARYLSDGSPDTGFTAAGFLNIDVLNPGSDGALTVALDSSGRTVVAGRSGQGTVLSPWEYANMTAVRLIAAPAQSVEFSGRVLDTEGKPVPNASVTLAADAAGTTYAGRTNFFGYFRLPNVQSAQTYTLSARAKGLNFYDRRVLVDDAVTNFLVVGEQ